MLKVVESPYLLKGLTLSFWDQDLKNTSLQLWLQNHAGEILTDCAKQGYNNWVA
jgi:hypothetical protein